MSRRWPLFGIFILSGAAGLVYEVVWGRQLVLVFGNTTQAVSAILTGFFGGMAIGSALGGRLADRVRRPLRMYGLLELFLVVIVLLTPVTFRLLHLIYRGVFDSLVADPQLLALVRFGLSLLALGPATILMGATLPTLTRHLSRDSAGLSLAFGRLYAANTFGAIIGTIAAGFILIELVGLTGTLLVGVGCSAIAGSVALLLDRAQGQPAAAAKIASPLARHATPPETSATADLKTHPRVRLALIVAFVSGLTSLGYQVLWTRLLASGTGNSTYVFTMILAIFLIGLALGAATFNAFRARIHTLNLLAFGQIAIALLVLLGMVILIGDGSSGLLALAATFRSLASQLSQLAVFMVVVLPATFVMGLTFPAASALVADPDGHVGSNTGLLLSANTLGAITGTFLVPFVVIPLVGSPVAVGLIALLNVSTGIALALAGRIEPRFLRTITATAGAVAAAMLVVALTSGEVFLDPNVAWLRAHHGIISRSAEDEIASVQAGAINGTQQLWVDRHLDDQPDGGRQADANPAADAPPALPDRPDDRVRDGVGVPGSAERWADRGGSGARPVGPADVRRLLPRRPPGASRSQGPRRHCRRPQLRRADRPPLRHHRGRSAATDLYLRRVGDLVARILRGGESAPESRRSDDAMDSLWSDGGRVQGACADVS